MNNNRQNNRPANGNPPPNPLTFADKARLIVAGFIGGVMTPMIQPLQEFLRSHRFPSEFGLDYWLVGAALGVLGAVMVWLLKETDVKKAIALGLSLPAFFTSLGGAVQNTSAPVGTGTRAAAIDRSNGAATASFFVTSAYAQPSPTPTATSSTRSLKVNLVTPAFACKLEMLDANGNVIATRDVSAAELSPLTLPWPDAATAIRVSTGAASSTKNLTAPAGQTLEVSIRGEGFRRKFNVAQVFGKAPDFVPDQISIELNVHP
jgi:hypothetical protein